ncbi:MAG: hypothetical protein NC388_08945 [Clostridium sp.]|nr:hypothetical protein [Clostridium sp.]
MKAVVDDKIPFIREALSRMADEVVFLPGSGITASDVRDADVLIVRTRTRCDRSLLAGSRVRFIATATIGYDHLDTAYLAESGIAWCNCPGCNAASVAQYVHACFLLLRRDKGYRLPELTVGVVGMGHVGSAVCRALSPLGVRILLNDPPREEQERAGLLPSSGHDFHPLAELQERCDVLTFHTPLVCGGAHPTFHLADGAFFGRLARRPVIINTSRGEVVDNAALLAALEDGCVSEAIVDTWENEPCISRPLLERVYIGTPHVAGYSADGKANATRMVLQAVSRFFSLPADFTIQPPSLPVDFVPSADKDVLSLQLYNPLEDSARLKADPDGFESQRGHYPLRREFCD